MALGDLRQLTSHEGKLTPWCEWVEISTVFDNSCRNTSRLLAPKAMENSSYHTIVGKGAVRQHRASKKKSNQI